ncbi:MAG: erythromycin esterase family protein, partial [Myxococcota bacterium]
ADVMLRFTSWSRLRGAVFYVRVAADGRYRLRLPKARAYILAVESDAQRSLDEVINGDSDSEFDLRVYSRAAVDEPASAGVISWLKGHAIPLATVEAESGFADMYPLKRLIGAARVVGLGEATHGTREFFQLKHRMLEFLVEHMGFSVFAIEASFSEALAVNEYVLSGTGDPAAALAGLYFWTWDTEEVLALIRWMRRYNRENRRKIKFYGIDMQFTPAAVKGVLSYLDRVDPQYAETARATLERFGSPAIRGQYAAMEAAERAAIRELIRATIARFDQNQRRYIRASSRRGWAVARQHAVVLSQAEAVFAEPERGPEIRDRAMADNLQWILANEPRGTKVVHWAHNGHVSRKGFAGIKSTGRHLHDVLGRKHVNFGFVFGHGSFQAMNWTEGRNKPGGLSAHTIEPGSPGQLGTELSRLGFPLFVLDMRTVPIDQPAGRWLHTPHIERVIGSVYRSAEGMENMTILPEHYDAVIFVDETTRARPNPTGLRPPPPAKPKADGKGGKPGQKAE